MKKGEVVGFLGPNGAGKTTTMRILTGFLPPSSGTCMVDGLDISTQGLCVRKKIGYLPESNPLYSDMEVLDYLLYIGGLRGLEGSRLTEGLREVTRTCDLKSVLDKKISTLSKGFRQRVGLAQALIHKPEVLILDEPTVGLDPNQIAEIRQLICDIGKDRTVLLSTHILSEVEQTCQRVLIIASGKIVAQGSPQELMAQSGGLPVYYVALRGNRNVIEAALKSMDGFKEYKIQKEEGDLFLIRLVLAGTQDRREELFRLAISKNLSLAELRREDVNLELVFKELTQ